MRRTINTDELGAIGEKILLILASARPGEGCNTPGSAPDLYFDRGFIEVKTTIAYYLHYIKRYDYYRIDRKYFVFNRQQHEALLEMTDMVDGFYGLVLINGKKILFRIIPISEVTPIVEKSRAKHKITAIWTYFFTDEEVGLPSKTLRNAADGGKWAKPSKKKKRRKEWEKRHGKA